MTLPFPPLPPTFIPEKEFPILNHYNFFNHAGVAPIAARAADALRKYARETETSAYLEGKHYKQAETVRQLAANLINADPKEIAFIKNTSEGLAFVANGLTWQAGDEIISTAVEYPSNVYPWVDVAQRFGCKHIMLLEKIGPDGAGRIPLEDILNAITPNTRMIALSHVEYASGFRHNLQALGEFCQSRTNARGGGGEKILLCVDAIQSVGIVPVDVRSMHIDFLSADGHKWMLAPEGAGIFFCRRELIPHLRPEIGWMNVINATDYSTFDFTLRPDAKRFECGSYNIPGTLALGAALQLIHDIGLETIHARVHHLTTLLADLLTKKGYHIFSPRNPHESSGILSFSSPTHNHDQIIKDLDAKKIILVQREKRLRASPHFYQSESHIHQLVDALPSH